MKTGSSHPRILLLLTRLLYGEAPALIHSSPKADSFFLGLMVALAAVP